MFRKLALGLFLLACLAFAGLWVAGSVLIHPAREIVGAPPPDFPASTVIFKSSSGAYRYSGSAYQIRVLGFFNKWLRGPSLR